MSRDRLAILGASGHGKTVADSALEGGWGKVIFFDDRWPAVSRVGDWAILGNIESFMTGAFGVDAAFVAIGNCRVRLAKQELLAGIGMPITTIIHPRAFVSARSKIGEGTVIMAGAVVNAFATIGEASIVNTGATVDHDCVVARGVHVAPGAHVSGDVRIGECAWIGVGAALRQGVKIGADAIVGAGAVVLADVPEHVTVVGCPAAPIRRRGEV